MDSRLQKYLHRNLSIYILAVLLYIHVYCFLFLAFAGFLLGLCKQKLNKFPVQWLCGRLAIYKSSISQSQRGGVASPQRQFVFICWISMLKLLSCLLFV